MKFKIIFFLLFSFAALDVFAQATTTKEIVNLKNGRSTITDNSFIYKLPFEKGTKRRVIQAAYSNLSHKGEIALDFNVKIGTTICAARAGIVVASFSESNIGGLKEEYLDDGNHVIIEHSDGSQAMYWHLQYKGALVKVGDTINAGQVIGKSGNTGYTAFPHLHFEVVGKTKNGTTAQLPVRFYTNKGVQYLKPLKKYKVV
jgi:murein DD-endopeptidase MepM/ murein hydrolase activator NlpD